VLSEVFGFHPLAIRSCIERNAVPKVRAYPDHIFVVLHGPELGTGGHVHYVELDQFIGPRYVVTVHGPGQPGRHPRGRVT
jgi:magnesium transporter